MGGDVSLTLTGPFALRRGGCRQSLHLAGNTRRLFVMLAAHHNQGLRRERVSNAIWSDATPERAGATLNTGLWRIKNVISGYEGLSVTTIDDIVRLEVPDDAQIDADQLHRAVRSVTRDANGQAMTAPQRDALRRAVKLCQAEFLEGESDHWVLPLRERYSALYVEALTLLMRDASENGEYEAALSYGREILSLDPFREGSQRAVMRLYVQNGQRVQAIRQYRALQEMLMAELEIEPMSETRALYDQIVGGAPSRSANIADTPSAQAQLTTQ